MTIKVRELQSADWDSVWTFMEPVIRAGETYPFARDMDEASVKGVWLEATHAVYVAEDEDGVILGTYYIKPNQPTLGAHVANCGYLVSAGARGRGIATLMGEHSQESAVRLGYRAMQFNLVVKTNEASMHIWNKLGFKLVGELEGAFLHSEHGYVDACVFYKVLVS
ncbi:MAG: GNAT family N-acetyltransferase [Woeseiaceae bacterium]|nr:GNAT family N-acetyltransferase [Woeseiaceae bacterium]